MPLYDFACINCSHEFEEIVPTSDSLAKKCPKCGSEELKKLVPKFRVGGRGDLRESTQHGCHEHHLTDGTHDHKHDHKKSKK